MCAMSHTVASFYPHFRLKPPVPVDVRVCNDMTCHLYNAQGLRNSLEGKYAGVPDVVRVRDISCVGRCDHAPIVTINDRYYNGMDLASATNLIDREIAQIDPNHPNAPHQHSLAPRSMEERGMVIRCDPYPDRASRYKMFKDLLQKENVDEVMQILKTGQLRGMGGAGFPTFIKWDADAQVSGHDEIRRLQRRRK